jgi:hypothetical protein
MAAFRTIMARRKATADELGARAESNGYKLGKGSLLSPYGDRSLGLRKRHVIEWDGNLGVSVTGTGVRRNL